MNLIRIMFCALGLLLTTKTFGQMNQFNGLNENYIITNSIQVENITNEGAIGALSVQSNNQTIRYFDGLGRLSQTVITQGSPLKKDIVQPVVYDAFGRDSVKYLSYVSTENNGWFKTDPIGRLTNSYTASPQYKFYQNANGVAHSIRPYAKTIFEESPLNRVLEEGAPGLTWQPDGVNSYSSTDKTIKMAYETNLSNEVLLWTYTQPNTTYPLGLVNMTSAATPTTPNYYLPNTLYKNRTKDENGNEIIQYTDIEGHIVLKRVQAIAGTPSINDTNYASTYYIYDDFGNLTTVIPPEAVSRLSTEYYQAGATDNSKNTFLTRWAFRYNYTDPRGRIVAKQMPGADSVLMIYDNRNRLVMTQDGNQRTLSVSRPVREWTFMKYDALNRIVLTGTYATNDSRKTIQEAVNTYYSTLNSGTEWFETYKGSSGSVLGYDNKSFPQVSSISQYLTVTYYDLYDSFIAPSGYTPLNQGLPGEKTADPDMVRGQVTGTQVKNLVTGTWLRTSNYYDEKYRLVHSIGDHQKGTVRISNVYDFAGKVMYSARKYIVNDIETTIKETLTYDHMGRPLLSKHSIKGAADVVLLKNEYNEIGQLVAKKLHQTDPGGTPVAVDPAVGQPGVIYDYDITSSSYNSNNHTYIARNSVRLRPGFHVGYSNIFKGHIGFSQQDADAYNGTLQETYLRSINYNYNIRGWLEGIHSDSSLFDLYLGYETQGLNGYHGYNGNITKIEWQNGGDNQQYSFDYDPMNRLKEAGYRNLSVLQDGRFNEKIGAPSGSGSSYDLNGNILRLSRYGKKGASAYGLMDDLTYTYDANRVTRIDDAIPKNTAEEGFKEDNKTSDEYTYDANGNMRGDKNKSITEITYNHLNLPQQVNKGTSDYIVYSYDATGNKLSQQVFGDSAKTTDYIGELVYENDVLQFINHKEGRAIPHGDSFEYQYHVKDHLGNIRVTFTSASSVETFTATMETGTQGTESATFNNYSSTSFDLFDHTDAGTTFTKTQLLNGGVNGKVGLAKSLAIKSGEKISVEVFAKYWNPTSTPNSASFITALAGAFGVSSSSTGEQLKLFNSLNNFATLYSDGRLVDDENAPQAFVTILLFDKDYNLMGGGWDQVTSDADQVSSTVKEPHDRLFLEVTTEYPGYAYIFVSNENQTLVDVYFDDLKITHTISPVISTNDYYPFGLTYNSYQRENSIQQNYLYNGKEVQDELDLEWLDYGGRMYMPEIGRWGVLDPHAAKYEIVTPYNYAFNNPMLFVDPDGRDNIIYLIVGNGITRRQANDVASKANTMLQQLGLKTQVIVYDSKKNGKFDEKKIDKTDNWAVVGTDRKEVSKMAKEISGDKSYDNALDEWSNNSGNPERSNNNGDGAKGIVVDYDDNAKGEGQGDDKGEESGLYLIHGAAHSSEIIQKTKSKQPPHYQSHTDQGVMQEGNELRKDYLRKGHGLPYILESNTNPHQNGNETYIRAMMSRYGKRIPKNKFE